MATENFTLQDMLDQLERVGKMGSIQSMLDMLPGMAGQISESDIDTSGLKSRRPSSSPDEERAQQPSHNWPVAPQAHRERLGHVGKRREQASQAVREDPTDHAQIREEQGHGRETHGPDGRYGRFPGM
jgi:hypothetical protein